MNDRVVSSLLPLLLVPFFVGAQQAAPRQIAPQDSAVHALNRLAYGPRPGEVERVAREGVMRWIDRQLTPDKIETHALAERERRFRILEYDRTELARMFVERRRARREAKHRLALVQQLAVVRAAVSERQLYEVMVDFWTNHFNVFFAKGANRFLAPSYIEETIRAHALGTFEELLIATAQSPAMLFYLDNWQSVRPGASPPFPRGQGGRTPNGINENYARELLELHTLGVDGGYTQQDVIAVARILTGWSIQRPQQGGGFEFHEWAHDRGEKQVLGVRFQAGHGLDEGIRLLELLASHPATMRHVSRKLCQRFVNDDPPDGCVDDAVMAWKRTDGDIREVLRAIFHGADFWAAHNQRAKVKTPLEFVVSAVRAVGADPDTTPRLARVVARLGQPVFLRVPPDGYPEKEEAWVNSGALLDRMNTSVALAADRLPGASVALDSVAPATTDPERLIAAVNDRVLAGTMSDNTKRVIREQLADVRDPVRARALAVGLALGGPEFQRQ